MKIFIIFFIAVRLAELDLENKMCNHTRVSYIDPNNASIERIAYVFRGPTEVDGAEALFLHFSGHDNTIDFYTVSYYLFPFWEDFNSRCV